MKKIGLNFDANFLEFDKVKVKLWERKNDAKKIIKDAYSLFFATFLPNFKKVLKLDS